MYVKLVFRCYILYCFLVSQCTADFFFPSAVAADTVFPSNDGHS
jgi:hypothetical protein